jgi:Ca2+-binding RTX toxin-like protein
LLGGAGNDILEGGTGNDNLTGGLGSDIFRFAAPNERRDTITDFVVGSDKVEVNGTNFGIQGIGSLELLDNLDVAHFVTSRSALTESDPAFIYNMSTGVLSFDADGQGHDGAVTLVKIIGIPELTAADIVIV